MTDHSPTDELRKIVDARETIKTIPLDAFEKGHLLTALEALDSIILDNAPDLASPCVATDGGVVAADGGEGDDTRSFEDRTSPVHEAPYEGDSSDVEIFAALVQADEGERVPVTVTFTQPMIERIDLERDEDEALVEWIRSAVSIRLGYLDMQEEYNPELEIDVPADVAQRAQLEAAHRAETNPDLSPREALLDVINDRVNPQPTFTVGGEPVVSFADDSIMPGSDAEPSGEKSEEQSDEVEE